MREQLAEAVEFAILASKPSPSNEQETCFRIIDPLLRAMAYGPHEIKVQDRDSAKQKPDYTLLPNVPELTWFLEAKAWETTLDNNHAIQAVNYANTQGKRWVVLSNGREWRLYDNHTLGTVEVKLACVAKLGDEAFLSFLDALSKPSIQQQKLEDFVRNKRLYSYLASQITRPDTEIIKAISKVLKTVPGLSNVPPRAIVRFWRDYAFAPSTFEVVPDAEVRPAPMAQEGQATSVDGKSNPLTGTFPLGGLSSTQIAGSKIKALTLPNGVDVSVSTWKQLTLQVALFVFNQHKPPSIPFFTSERSKSPLVARSSSTEAKRIREPMQLPAPHADLLVEGHYSADGHQGACVKLLRASGVEPATFQIVI